MSVKILSHISITFMFNVKINCSTLHAVLTYDHHICMYDIEFDSKLLFNRSVICYNSALLHVWRLITFMVVHVPSCFCWMKSRTTIQTHARFRINLFMVCFFIRQRTIHRLIQKRGQSSNVDQWTWLQLWQTKVLGVSVSSILTYR